LAPAPEPKPLDEYLRDPYAAKDEQRRRDARLAFAEKVESVLELQEASRLMREAARDSGRLDRSAGVARHLEHCGGTTRSSWSAVVTSTAGYRVPGRMLWSGE
jgi:hypothetical protein